MIRLFRVFIPTSVVGLLLIETLLIFGLYSAVLFWRDDFSAEIYLLYEGGFGRVAIVTVSILLGLYFNDLYSKLWVRSRVELMQQFCLVLGLAFLLQALFAYAAKPLTLGRWHMIVGSSAILLVLPPFRIAYSHLVFEVLYRRKVLFLGSSEVSQMTAAAMARRREFGFDTLGYLASEPLAEPGSMGPWLGPPGEIKRIWEQTKPNLVVVGMEERRGQLPVAQLLDLRMMSVRIDDVSSLFETLTGRVPLKTLRPSSLIFSSDLGPHPGQIRRQILYSQVIAALGAVLTLPVMALAWLAIRATSRGPAIYSQERVGLRGRVFRVHKFRSMYIDAESRTGAVWATQDDPRITPVGRWLRKLRIDELPQFLNVLKGEMAIVGPRPERPEFVSALSEKIPFYGRRHAVMPGITGWAQICYKYGDTIEDTISKLEYDLYYIKHMSMSLDFYIMFQTVKVMLLWRGAR